MKELNIIKNSFQPIQPSVGPKNKHISYLEKRPNNDIDNFIYCYWQLKSRTTLKSSFTYRVVSDGCIDIIFNNKKPTEGFVIGFCRKYSEFEIGNDFDYVGIRFLPTAFSLMFGISAKSLVEKTQALDLILPYFSSWVNSRIKQNLIFEDIIVLLNDKFRHIISSKKFNLDSRFFNSLQIIFDKRGHLDTERDLDVGISPRQLRRLFNFYIGITPKSFCNIVRFQYILNLDLNDYNIKNQKHYLDVGFYDQAHFIKTFKTFYGITPSKAYN